MQQPQHQTPINTNNSLNKDYKCKVINGVCWRKDYVFISKINVFVSLFFLLLGISLIIYIVSFNQDHYDYLIPLASVSIFYSFILFVFSRYAFLKHRWFKWKNEYIDQAIKTSSLFYSKGLKLKYCSIIVYQFFMFLPFFYAIFLPTSGDTTTNWTTIIVLLFFYSSWFFLILIDYINSYKNETIKDKNLSITKKITGFLLYAFFWCFMIKAEDYVVKDEKTVNEELSSKQKPPKPNIQKRVK